MAKRSKNKNISRSVGRAALLMATVILVIYMATLLGSSETFYADSALKNVGQYHDRDLHMAEALLDIHYQNLYGVAARLDGAASTEQVQDVMTQYIGSEEFGNLHYFSQGSVYSVGGSLLDATVDSYSEIRTLANSRSPGCTAIFRDALSGYDCIAFYAPVQGSAYVDGVLSILQARNLVDLSGTLGEKTSVALLVSRSGMILASASREGFEYPVGNELYEFAGSLTADKAQINTLRDAMNGSETAVCTISMSQGEYIAALTPVDILDDAYMFVTLSESQGLVGNETVYINHVVTVIIASMVLLAIGIAVAMSYSRQMNKTIAAVSYTDTEVGCPNLEQFKKTAKSAVNHSQHSFAVCVIEIRQFRILSETISHEEVVQMLQFVAKILETFCAPRETYGYLGDGKFAHLLIYSGGSSIRDRIRLVETMANKNSVLGRSKSNRKFNIGVSIAQTGKNTTVEELLDQAGVACSRVKNNVTHSYEVYTEQVNAEREHTERIEAEMEQALANGEFRLFLQPKYNVAEDRIDSAEALVRWFDPKTGDYRFPGEFIGLFETNGFITRLDHFMYIEALKMLSTAAERGEKVVPVSVNVSLVTVNSEDFLEFYIQNKKKYKIPDGFITMEFTESFNAEDNSQIRQIVGQLKRNGICCSLDDFGTGYASLGALKSIPLDEIKLDRMFLREGVHKGHDRAILSSMISLGKALGLRVVQEGVETREMFETSVALGCDVIQGYYYAKAVSVEEYRLFINSNTSIRYKAQVK